MTETVREWHGITKCHLSVYCKTSNSSGLRFTPEVELWQECGMKNAEDRNARIIQT